MKPHINQRDLAYYFLSVAGFNVINGIVIDGDTKQPILHQTHNGPKYIYYNPDGKINTYSMIELDVSKNNKVIETLFNYWCGKQRVFNNYYIKYFNIYHKNNNKHSKDMRSEVIIWYKNIVDGNPYGEELKESSGVMANDAMAFSYLITKIEERDINEILTINEFYKVDEVNNNA